jgi:hypothetical protein
MGDPHEYSMIPRMQQAGIDRHCQSNGGGTRYGCAFEAVWDLFEVNPSWERADLLFLSDGGDAGGWIAHSQESCEKLQQRGVRVFGVGLIDADHGHTSRMKEVMEKSMGYFNAYMGVMFGAGMSDDDVIKQVAEGL